MKSALYISAIQTSVLLKKGRILLFSNTHNYFIDKHFDYYIP